jgi:hypothetical protein
MLAAVKPINQNAYPESKAGKPMQLGKGGRYYYESILDQEEAEAFVERWLPRIGLHGWSIFLHIIRAAEMPGDQGRIRDSQEHRVADLCLLDPRDYSKGCPVPQDMEATALHELLHIHFNRLQVSKKNRAVEEQVICLMADAMLAPYRQQPS